MGICFLSSFQPVKVLKSMPRMGIKGTFFRKVLVIFQFSISIILIVFTIAISRQLTFLMNNDIGFNKENLVYLGMPPEIKQKYFPIKNEILQNPNILNVTASTDVPTRGHAYTVSNIKWEEKNPDK